MLKKGLNKDDGVYNSEFRHLPSMSANEKSMANSAEKCFLANPSRWGTITAGSYTGTYYYIIAIYT